MKQTYIIIVTYNGMSWLDKCLRSCGDYPIIVVDNASTDDTVFFIKTNFRKVVLLEQEENLGFGAANNLGISYALQAGADHVFLLNQDAYLVDGCIIELLKVYESRHDVGVLSPVHLNGKGNKLDRNFSYYMTYDSNDIFYFDAIQGKLKPFYRLPFVNAAGWLVPRSTLEKVGGFDPIFFHYGEDENYCQRLNYHNLDLLVVTDAFIKHDRENIIKSKQNQQELKLKIKWANINTDGVFEMELRRRILKKKYYLSLFKLRWRSAFNYKSEIVLINSLVGDIKKSITLNRKLGSHYLNYE